MSVKTCQLCGKPLSKFRVGADPDFCSKDHRNQFRLRKGMNRLEEVNKVANLMRRRESAKQITFSSLMCQSAISPRGFYETKRTAIHTVPFTRQQVQYQKTEQPRITAHADDCIVPRVRRQSGVHSIRRPNNGRVRIKNLNSQPVFPDGRWTVRARIVQAPPSDLPHRAPARPQRREFKLLRQSGKIRVHMGKGPGALRRVPLSGTEAFRQGICRLRIASIAAKGNALRVSVSQGFKIPPVKIRNFQSRLATRSALVYTHRTMTVATNMINREAIVRALKAQTTAIAMRLPDPPHPSHNSQFHALGALPPAMGSAMPGTIPGARFTGISWTAASVQWSPAEIHPPGAGFARRNGAHLKRLLVTPNGVVSNPQVSFSPFIPQEPKGCPVVPFQAVIAGGAPPPTAAPTVITSVPEAPDLDRAPAPVRVAVHFEDHFDNGWDNWVGGVQDWLVDVAGVRTGSMALFMPTLDLTDYELEFLGRIDSKTINWVVRAAGLDQHIRCTLTLVENQQVEFSRTFVRGGNAEDTVVSSTRVPGKKRSTITIRTVVTGHDFAVTVDGNIVAEWAERRLPSGGVGFMGSAEDRARLYWVKVSSSAPARSN